VTVRAYTANYGGRDRAWPQVEQSIPVEWVYFTDIDEVAPAPWTTIQQFPNPELHRNLAAKWYKTHPFGVGEWDDDARYAIWIDASMEVTNPRFAAEAIASLEERPVAAWAHPRRDCIYEEAKAALTYESVDDRYADQPVLEQVASYRAEGHPEHGGLYACGTIVWTRDAIPLGEAWWDECVRWSMQDQLSFPVVARRLGIRPAVFPVGQIEHRTRSRVARAPQNFSRSRSGAREVGSPTAAGEVLLGNRWLTIHPHVPGTDR